SLIPILLIQRDGLINKSNNDIDSKKNNSSPEYNSGWNIIMPSGWGMDFWKSFVFAGAWVGGLRERHSNHFESGMQCFPYDFPGARSYNIYSKQQKEKHEQEYLKKPPAKRVNYKKFQVTCPFEPGFEALVGIENVNEEMDDIIEDIDRMDEDNTKGMKNEEEENMTDNKPQSSTQHDSNITETGKQKDTQRIAINPVVEQKLWLLRGAKNIKLLEKYCVTCPDSVEEFLTKLKTQIRDTYMKRVVSLLPE
ncbi:4866_t:CDS:2, partial [Cetraspora pellucida]